MYEYDQKPGTRIADDSVAVLQKIQESEYAVLVGKNNCGKSFLLKTITQKLGQNASYLGPARYQNFNLLSYYTPNRDRKNRKWQEFINQWQQQHQNIDNSPVNLQQAIAELSDEQRRQLTEIINTLLGVRLEIRHTVESNSMSQKYISCGGHNISFTSSGFRLITTLVTSLLDADYNTFLIDEPELGISPEAQGILADFLFDRTHRKQYFPHINTLIFATHSTIFLDRNHIKNNYMIEKNGDEISIKSVEKQMNFNSIHFFLLGNRFETLYLPSAIVLVEGKSDHTFIDRVIAQRYPELLISVICANSDNRIKEILNIAKSIFADIQKSPYRDRIFVILDSVHTLNLSDQLIAMGVLQEHIIIWPENGIEFYYPPSLLDNIFGAGEKIRIDGDIVSRNGIEYKKADLASKVISLLNPDTLMHEDFSTLFLARLEKICVKSAY